MEKIESTQDDGDSSWIVDDNINYDSDSDEKHDEEEAAKGDIKNKKGMKGIDGKMDGHQNQNDLLMN